jgi:glycosyltransferase involved in cell wall biosynthesis
MKVALSTPSILPISVIVPTLNRGEYLIQTIKDLLNQHPPTQEIIVVDQTELHDYELEVRNKIDTLAASGEIIYEQIERCNANVARNHGLRVASGEIVVFVDDDIRAPEDLCLAHYRNYQPPHSVDAVGGMMLGIGKEPTYELYPQYDWPHVGFMFRPLSYGKRLDSFDMPTCNMSVRRRCALAIGGFDERMERCQDTDFSWRLHQAGVKAVYDPDAWVRHLVAPEGAARHITAKVNRFVRGKRDRWREYFYFVMKNFGLRRGWRMIWYWVRKLIVNRSLLLRPHYFVQAVHEFVQGYCLARKRLDKGPIYMDPASSDAMASSN